MDKQAIAAFNPARDRVGALKLVLYCEGDADVGLGHVKRCITLAQWLAVKPLFAVQEMPAAARGEITAAGFETTDIRSADDAQTLPKDADAIVLDFAHWRAEKHRDQLRNRVALFARSGMPLVFIDAMAEKSLVDETLDEMIALAVQPYAGAENEERAGWLAGPEYFIVSPTMADAASKPRAFPERAEKLLITTGGGDVGEVGPLALRSLNAIGNMKLDVRIVCGPLMREATRTAVAGLAAASRHRVKVIGTRPDLTADFQWCDMAIATTGLTKYEMALNGVPGILISPNREHEMNNRFFRERNTALDLGVAKQISEAEIADAVCQLATSSADRESYAKRGRALIDGKGAVRLLGAIKSLKNAH